MAQMTEDLAKSSLKQCQQGQRPPLTIWEIEQLLWAWLDRERLRELVGEKERRVNA